MDFANQADPSHHMLWAWEKSQNFCYGRVTSAAQIFSMKLDSRIFGLSPFKCLKVENLS